MIYFDTSYIVRLYLQDQGWEAVRKLAATDKLACSLLGRAETVAAFHRKFHEHSLTQTELNVVILQFQAECVANAFQWLPLAPAIIDRGITIYSKLPNTIHLRAADAIHLATAAENGFKDIYSNDTNLLKAAPHFGLAAVNVI